MNCIGTPADLYQTIVDSIVLVRQGGSTIGMISAIPDDSLYKTLGVAEDAPSDPI